MAGTAKCPQPALSKRCPGRDPSLEACVLLDPVSQAGEPAVHPRFVPLGTAITPAHHTGQEHPTAGFHTDQGSPRVSLAGIHTTSQNPHAHHAWCQLVCQELVTHSLVDEPDLCLLQDGGSCASFCSRSPSGHPQVLAHREVVGGIGQADGLDDSREGDGALQLQHSNVIVVGVVIEEGVGDNALDFVGLHIGATEITLVGQSQVGCP